MKSWSAGPVLAAVLATVFFGMAIHAVVDGDGTHFIKIRKDLDSDARFQSVSLLRDLDYGSFRWMELDPGAYRQLVNSGIPFQEYPEAGMISVPGYRFDPLRDGEPALDPARVEFDEGKGFRIVQFAGPVKGEWIENLESANLEVLQYYPNNAYLVWGTKDQALQAAKQRVVRWQGSFHPAYKVNGDLAVRAGLIQNVDIILYNDGNMQATLDDMRLLGANILNVFPSQPDGRLYDAVVELDAESIESVARISTVLWLGYASPEPELEDEMSDQIVAGNHPGGVPALGYWAHLASLGVDGTGVTWAVIDTGVDYDHPDLGPHIVGGYSFPGACNPAGQPGSDCAGGGHGTHVAGIIGGDATAGFTDAGGFLYGLGMAPSFGIFTTNSLVGNSWPPAGGWQEHSKQAVLGGAVGSNNSWTTGEGTAHGYQASERTHDIMVRDGNFDTASTAEPLIMVFSAGNSGSGAPNRLTAPKEAKNLIVTASSRNYRAGSIDTISTFSSRGPAIDGRWVPTIAAPGEAIASSRNDLGGDCSTAIAGTNDLYAFCSGTSMAAPHASGAVVLATEWWRTFNGGADPSPAMAKALLVNGAVDMGTADIPNIHEGWGRINITNVITPAAPTDYRDQVDLFQNSGESLTIPFVVPNPALPLKVTLVWSDAPGAVGANPALVNDLNLTVSTGGNTYLGNNYTAGWSVTGGSADTLNNLENVYVASPGSTAVVTIDAFNIAGDGVPYNGDVTDQDFALVIFNADTSFVPVTVSGRKFEDLNGDGTDDGGTDPGLENWTIELDLNADGSVDASTATAADGTYSFTNVGPGTHRVREVPQAGWVQTTTDPADITVVSGTDVTGIDFGNTVPGSIHGFKYDDVNGDGVYNDLVDLPLAGVTFTLTGTDGMGNAVGPDVHTTDSNGEFWFVNLPPGNFTVTETVPAGWTATTPTDFTGDIQSRQELVWQDGAANLPPGAPQVEVLIGAPLMFGNFQLFDITGFKWDDRNYDGVWDPGEPPLAGWEITLDIDADGFVDDTAITAADGSYGFFALGPGTYRVREVVQADWVQITVDPLDIVGQSGVDVPDVNFGNYYCVVTCDAAPDVTEGPNPLTVTFTATAEVAPVCPWAPTWDWDFGDGIGTSTVQNPVYTYTTPGDHTWTMTVTNGGVTCSVSGTIHVFAYDLTFVDDYGRSWACANSTTGDWEWTALDPRVGVFNTGMQPGIVQATSGILAFRSIAGMPWSMGLKYNMSYKRAYGYFQYLSIRIRSSLNDLNTSNNPPFCDAPPNP